MELSIARIYYPVKTLGPGNRIGIWTAGCPRRCSGCISPELQHAEAYLQIQKYRYKNQFTYHFTVDESCTQYLCNKITLQPIIENAIYHGINGLVDEGEIRISCRADGDDILFTVEDNGTGMEPEQALDALDASVRLVRDALREKDRAAVRLYPSLGLAAGCLLAVLLL